MIVLLFIACIKDVEPIPDSGVEPDDSADEGLAIIGDWLDVDSGLYVIKNQSWRYQAFEEEWTDDTILSYDNDLGYVIAQNDAAGALNPGLFSRYDFKAVEGFWQYCHSTDEAETEQDAEIATAPEDCGWVELVPAI